MCGLWSVVHAGSCAGLMRCDSHSFVGITFSADSRLTAGSGLYTIIKVKTRLQAPGMYQLRFFILCFPSSVRSSLPVMTVFNCFNFFFSFFFSFQISQETTRTTSWLTAGRSSTNAPSATRPSIRSTTWPSTCTLTTTRSPSPAPPAARASAATSTWRNTSGSCTTACSLRPRRPPESCRAEAQRPVTERETGPWAARVAAHNTLERRRSPIQLDPIS